MYRNERNVKKSSHAEWGFNLLHNTNVEVGWRGRDEGGTHRVAPVRNMHLVSGENTIPGVRRFLLVRHQEKPSRPWNRDFARHLVHVARGRDTTCPACAPPAPADRIICIIPAGSFTLLQIPFAPSSVHVDART